MSGTPDDEKLEEECVKSLNTENDLINHRLTWLLAGQPLLLLAYANLVSVKVAQTEQFVAAGARQSAVYWLPWIGFGSALAVWTGVIAATVAFRIVTLRRPSRRFGVHWATTITGFVPPLLIPPLLMCGWLLVRDTVEVRAQTVQQQVGRFQVIQLPTTTGAISAMLDTATGKLTREDDATSFGKALTE